MKIQFMSKNYTISDKLERIITEKVSKLDRYFEDSASAKVVCSRVNKDTFKLELTIKDKGLLFRSEVISDNMYQNIDLALPKVERQIVKYSKKIQDKLRKNVDLSELMFNEMLEDDFKPDESMVSKVKKFDIYPLTTTEAIMELENSDHAFYVYVNEKGKVNIIYKRSSGDYGIIDPTVII